MPTGAESATEPSGTPSAAEAKVDLDHELRTVEEQVDALKERVFRSKATLQLLQEIVAEEPDSGSKGVFWYENALGRTYTVERIAYLLDGETRFSKEDTTGALNATRELKVVEGPLAAGTHNLLVEVRVRPTGFGLFNYAKSYTIDVRSSYSFEAELGKTCSVRSVLNDKGGSARTLEDRARIDFELTCERNTDAPKQK